MTQADSSIESTVGRETDKGEFSFVPEIWIVNNELSESSLTNT
jgi:hypothetical protein